MSTTAFELVVLPTCLAVSLGAVVGFCLATFLRGVDPRIAAQAGRLGGRDRLSSSVVPARGRSVEGGGAGVKSDPPAESPRRDDLGGFGPCREPIVRDRDDEMGFLPSRRA